MHRDDFRRRSFHCPVRESGREFWIGANVAPQLVAEVFFGVFFLQGCNGRVVQLDWVECGMGGGEGGRVRWVECWRMVSGTDC